MKEKLESVAETNKHRYIVYASKIYRASEVFICLAFSPRIIGIIITKQNKTWSTNFPTCHTNAPPRKI